MYHGNVTPQIRESRPIPQIREGRVARPRPTTAVPAAAPAGGWASRVNQAIQAKAASGAITIPFWPGKTSSPVPVPEGRIARPRPTAGEVVRSKRWVPREGWRQKSPYDEPFALLGDDYGIETFEPLQVPTVAAPAASGTPWWQNILNTIGGAAGQIIQSKANAAVQVSRAQDVAQMNRYGYTYPLPGPSVPMGPSTSTVLIGGAALLGAYLLLSKRR